MDTSKDGPQYRVVDLSDGRKARVRSSPPTLTELSNLGGVIVDVFAEGKLNFAKVIRNMPILAAESVAPAPIPAPVKDGEKLDLQVWVDPKEVAGLGSADGVKIVDAAVDWLEMVPLESIIVILGKVGALAASWAAQRRTSARASGGSPQESQPPSTSGQEK